MLAAGDLATEIGDSGDLRSAANQAAGMISEQLDVRIAVAFTRLRAYAYATKKPINEVARRVVDRALRFDPDGRGAVDGNHDEESE